MSIVNTNRTGESQMKPAFRALINAAIVSLEVAEEYAFGPELRDIIERLEAIKDGYKAH